MIGGSKNDLTTHDIVCIKKTNMNEVDFKNMDLTDFIVYLIRKFPLISMVVSFFFGITITISMIKLLLVLNQIICWEYSNPN